MAWLCTADNTSTCPDLDVNGNDIVSVSNGNINLLPNGSGKVIMDGNGSSGVSIMMVIL